MNKKNIVIFSALISALYILTIAVLVSSLAIEYSSGNTDSQEQFTSLTKSVAAVLRSDAATNENSFSQAMQDSMNGIENLACIQITSGDTVYYSYPADISTAATTSSFVRSYSTTITAENGSMYTLTAALYLLKPSSIYSKCRIAFLVILAGTIASIIYLIYVSKQQKDIESSTADEANESISSFNPDTIIDSVKKNDDSISAQTDASETNDSDVKQNTDFSGQVVHSEQVVPSEQVILSEQVKEPVATTTEENGLFSPVTGFGWESYMLTRLDSELVRAASSEQDLALFTIRIPYLDRTWATAKEIYALILETFKFKDLVFEYKEDGCTAIMQNVNIDQALSIADNLHIAITAILSKAGIDSMSAIGISSRSLRLISGERLTKESEQALIHAFEDKESPVIAFRVNPEKYRDYLSSAASTISPDA